MTSAKKSVRVLIIEDESGITLALYKSLNAKGYKIDSAKTGASGLRKANARSFDIIMLDLGLPDMSGLTICRQLRNDGISAPIIILTGESSVKSKVNLFNAGANDYITKPFSLDELQARIQNCLRPTNQLVEEAPLEAGELKLNIGARTVQRGTIVISLRRKEFAILELLMQHAGSVVSRASLMNHGWEGSDDRWTNTVDVHIKHLRDKIDKPFTKPLIKTVHGLGYKLETSKNVAKIL